jgi:hypothetical protein
MCWESTFCSVRVGSFTYSQISHIVPCLTSALIMVVFYCQWALLSSIATFFR